MLQAPYRQIAVDCQINQTLVNGEPALQLSADINHDNISGFPGLQLHLAAGRPYCVSAEIFNLVISAIERHYDAYGSISDERTNLPECLIHRLLQRPSADTGWKLFRATILADRLRLEYCFSENVHYQISIELRPKTTDLKCHIVTVGSRIIERLQLDVTFVRHLSSPNPLSGLSQTADYQADINLWQSNRISHYKLDTTLPLPARTTSVAG